MFVLLKINNLNKKGEKTNKEAGKCDKKNMLKFENDKYIIGIHLMIL